MSIQQKSVLSQYSVASLDHMTHIDNLDSIMKYGLLAHNNPYKQIDISNQDVNSRRDHRENIYGRKVHDYVPFYFNPRNAMMYKNRNENIVILAFDTSLIYKDNIVFTNKNASTDSVKYFKDINGLSKLNWNYIWRDSWNDDVDSYCVKQTMMAEVLVYQEVSIKYLKAIICKDEGTKNILKNKYSNLEIIVNRRQFFK